MSLRKNGMCLKCGQQETAEHVLMECKAYEGERGEAWCLRRYKESSSPNRGLAAVNPVIGEVQVGPGISLSTPRIVATPRSEASFNRRRITQMEDTPWQYQEGLCANYSHNLTEPLGFQQRRRDDSNSAHGTKDNAQLEAAGVPMVMYDRPWETTKCHLPMLRTSIDIGCAHLDYNTRDLDHGALRLCRRTRHEGTG
ncbi:hypothetical protein J6590_058327 [Homalodisca vitripennis]|nr:hypothetical protein J6590_058327 [Homalodisca vitripennis]